MALLQNKEELFELIHKNYSEIVRTCKSDLSTFYASMHKACYYPPIKRTAIQIFRILKILNTPAFKAYENILKNEIVGEENWFMHMGSDPISWLFILLMRYGHIQNKKDDIEMFFMLFTLRFYTISMYRSIKFCNKDRFEKALQTLAHSHLYNTKGSILGALFHMNKTILAKYYHALENFDKTELIKMIYRNRNSVKQSVKSFARRYYDGIQNQNPNLGGDSFDSSDQIQEGVVLKHAEKVVNKIVIFKQVDSDAIDIVNKITKISSNNLNLIIAELSQVSLQSHLKTFYTVLLTSTQKINEIFESEDSMIKYTHKLLVLRKTANLRKVTLQIIEKMSNTKEIFDIKSNSVKNNILRSIAFYLAIFMYRDLKESK